MANLLQVVLISFAFCIGQLTAKSWEKSEEEKLEKRAVMNTLPWGKRDRLSELDLEKQVPTLSLSKRKWMNNLPWGKRDQLSELDLEQQMPTLSLIKKKWMNKLPWGKRDQPSEMDVEEQILRRPLGKRYAMQSLPWGKRNSLPGLTWRKLITLSLLVIIKPCLE